MLRIPYDGSRLSKHLYAVVDRHESIDWVFKATFGEKQCSR